MHTAFGRPTSSLVRGTTTVRTVASCNSDQPFENVQFVGRTNALVYKSGCAVPSGDVWTLDPASAALRRVTNTYTDEFDPALSADGSRIVYSEQAIATFCKGCAHNLWVTPGQQLTAHDDADPAPYDDNPTFSPDGAALAFIRSGADSKPTLMTMPVTGGAATSLGIVLARYPAWGARGIAFVADGDPAQIRLVDPATRVLTTLATLPRRHDAGSLTWAPDGRLAYVLYDDAGHASIAIVGGRTIRLAQRRVTGLAWSPDGTRFAYVADDANGYGEVWTIAADGTDARQVTRDLGVMGTLSWR